MIHWVIDNIRPQQPHRFIFVCLAEHLQNYPEISIALKRRCPRCEIVTIDRVTEGAACTVLLARELIDNDDALMIANSDQLVEADIDKYLCAMDGQGADGIIMTFWSDDPKWSYCRMNPDGTVCEVVEKEVVSNEATVGIYNFRRGRDFVRAASRMIELNLRVKGEFYVAPVYNQLIAGGGRICTHSIGRDGDGMHGLGTPQDLRSFLALPASSLPRIHSARSDDTSSCPV